MGERCHNGGMKKYFIAYRHTGEDIMELEKRIRVVETALMTKSVQAYATLFDEEQFQKNSYSAGQIMERAFQKISIMDGLFVLINGDEKSEGQLIEVGYALALKKPVVVARRDGAKTYVDELTNLSIIYSDFNDLSHKIMSLNI